MDKSTTLSVLRETIPSVPEIQTRATDSETGKFVPEYWETLTDVWGSSSTETPLTPDEAIQLAAVLICIDVLAQDIAKTPLRLMRRTPNRGKQVVEPGEHWLAAMYASQPNVWHTWVEFLEMLMLNLALTQNGFIIKKRKNRTEIAALLPVMSSRIHIDVNSDLSDYVYNLSKLTNHEQVMLKGVRERLISDEVIHIRGRLFNGLTGYSTMVAGAGAMRLAQQIRDFQSRLYKNDGTHRGVFQAKEGIEVDDEVFTRLRQQLGTGMKKMVSKGLPLLLDGGVEFKGISMTSDDAQTDKSLAAAIIDVCRYFRMPPHKALHLEAVKYENLDTIEKSYAADTLVPWALRIEQRIDADTLTPDERKEFFSEFDREAMVVSDVKTLAEVLKVSLSLGAITYDEFRQRRGLNPLANGQGAYRMIPSTYTVIDEKGETVLAAGGMAPGEEGGAENDPKDPASKPAGKPAKDAEIVPLPRRA